MSTSLVRSVFFSCLRQELHQARGVLTSSQMLRLMVQELSTPFFREIFSEKKTTSQIEPVVVHSPKASLSEHPLALYSEAARWQPKSSESGQVEEKVFF